MKNITNLMGVIIALLTMITIANTSYANKHDFVVFGDFGDLKKEQNMNKVASSMNAYCHKVSCDFALLAGDNIYNKGASGVDKKADQYLFDNIFIKPYGKLGQYDDDFRIYTTLGNHDWQTSRKGALAQLTFLEKTKPFYMDNFFYRVVPANTDGEVEIFVIDTTMMLSTRTMQKTNSGKNGSRVKSGKTKNAGSKKALPQNSAEKNMLNWLEASLKDSTAKWKIVLAHHPLWSSAGGKFDQSALLRPLLLPLLCRYADAYFAGHEHTLEVHTDSCEVTFPDEKLPAFTHVVSGSATKGRTVNSEFIQWQNKNNPQLKNLYAKGDILGFSHVTLDGDHLNIRMLTLSEATNELIVSAKFKLSHRSE